MHRLHFTSLAQAAKAVADLGQRPSSSIDVSEGTWSAARVLHHCAASIECSVRGFPRHKPWPIRVIARRFVLPKWLARGFMSHARNEPVPGLVEEDPGPDIAPAVQRLLAAIAAFEAAATLAPHAAFGDQPRDLYARYNALHIADHMSVITVAGAPFTP